MTEIRCGDSTVEVHAEQSDRTDRNGYRYTVYVPNCCSSRYPSLRMLRMSHMSGCPRDREIEQLMDTEGRSEA